MANTTSLRMDYKGFSRQGDILLAAGVITLLFVIISLANVDIAYAG